MPPLVSNIFSLLIYRKDHTSPKQETYFALVTDPDIFLHVDPFPPQTPHLSNFFLESMMRSQPAFTHCPWTQTEVESGLQGVPSTTCKQSQCLLLHASKGRDLVTLTLIFSEFSQLCHEDRTLHTFYCPLGFFYVACIDYRGKKRHFLMICSLACLLCSQSE